MGVKAHNEKTLIDLSAAEAKGFLLKEKSYVSFDLPDYFTFQNLLDKVGEALNAKPLSHYRTSNPRACDGINYKLLYNKDGNYAWRSLQVIHPAIYISLVNQIAEEKNWRTILDRFGHFRENEKIECHSIPVVPDSANKSDKIPQIFTWWQKIEQRSVAFALDYRYMIQTDISNCYDSIYTHSIAWAIHTREKAKENRRSDESIGNTIDTHLQDMNSGQTNGIPQGSVLMDFLAEMVLGYVDSLLTEKIGSTGKTGQSKPSVGDYRILRYRDDYRIFSNNLFEAGQVAKYLSETLAEMGLKLNAEKTKASDDVIKNSLKPDKRYWIAHKQIAGKKWKWLMQLHLLSAQFPNSGTLDNQMRKFLQVIQKQREQQKKKDSNIDTLISLVVEIGYRNPRVLPQSAAILLFFLDQIKDKKKKESTFDKVRLKFEQMPNSSINEIWLHWVSSKIGKETCYEEKICQKVTKSDTAIWNTAWLTDGLKQIIDSTPIIDDKKRKDSLKRPTPTEGEMKNMGGSSTYN